MKKSIVMMAAAVAAVGLAESARAQSLVPLAVEARASAAVPTGSFSDFEGGIGTGYGFGVNGSLKLNPLLGIYGGYSWTGYDLDARDETLTQQGLDAGVRVGLGLLPMRPYARGGVVYHKLDDGHGHDNERKLGYEVGAGLSFPLGMVISVTPEVTYTRINDAIEGQDLSAVRVGIGLRAGL
ncbi:MAG TPA: outer membrane beta-barrel protein [Longimicrobiaceae bacterium]|nr:outer membrane beta-barrel protein [Longimicrobiaceae bacterium]